MSGDHNFPSLVFFIKLFIIIDFPLLELITIMFLVIHVNSPFLQLLHRNVIFDKPITVVLQINNVIDGNVQKPNHNVESLLIYLHDVVNPCDYHEKGVQYDK